MPASLDRPDVNSLSGLLSKWALAAVAASVSETVTFPLDVTKTRLQLQNELGHSLSGAPAKRLGMFQMAYSVARNEGFLALYAGWSVAVMRQVVYGGIGIGLYKPVRELICGKDAEAAPFGRRLLAGCFTGALGQAVSIPFDVIKVRTQADGRLKLLGKPPRYNGVIDAVRTIARDEGFAGFVRGFVPTIQRAAVINGTGLAVYDHTKHVVVRVLGTTEGVLAHFLSSVLSGFACAVVSAPFDVIKTRLINQDPNNRLYRGTIDCFLKTVRQEGVMALYKGFVPSYTRLAPWQVVFFLSYEQLSLLLYGSTL